MATTTKCQLGDDCQHGPATTNWQPLNDMGRVMVFTDFGAAYPQYPVIKVCDWHRMSMDSGVAQNFKFAGQWYLAIPKANEVVAY